MNDCETSINKKLADVRQQIVDTLLEIDDINLQVNPQLLARYAKTIGYLENDLYKWQLKARRAKRKFTLVQASVNKCEPISIDKIERALDEEFAEWELQLAKQASDQLQFLEMLAGSRPLSPSEERELKKLHKKLIRRLHPDIHPDLPEEALRFFLIAQSAYENGDVATLRVVDTATEDYEESAEEEFLSDDDAMIELAMAEAQLNIAQEQLDTLKHSYPYTLSELLDNPAKLIQRKRELEAEIEKQKEIAQTYEVKTANLSESEKE